MALAFAVKVTREGDAWLADVVNLPGAHTYAADRDTLDRDVREVIELVAVLPGGAELELHYREAKPTP